MTFPNSKSTHKKDTPMVRCPSCGGTIPFSEICLRCGDSTDPRLGLVLDGKYRIEALLGQGGYGRVYRARHLGLEAQVAVKFLLSQGAPPGGVHRERFRREALALARLSHPGIVAVHDLGEQEGAPYMVMELCRGRPLFESLLVDGRTMAPERLCRIFDQLLEVLEVAHREGIVHRDMKPENILLMEAGYRPDAIKVLDFGLALWTESPGNQRLTAEAEVNGTPIYMSPEQCRGGELGPPTDIYSVGVMLFEMLAGEPPFTGESVVQLMAQHIYVAPPAVSARGLKKEPPPGLEALAHWAMAKGPDERPTAGQFREALSRAMDGTDAASVLGRSAGQKAAEAGSGSKRGLISAAPRTEFGQGFANAPTLKGEQRPYVVLWGMEAGRMNALRVALAVNGIDSQTWDPDQAPPKSIGERTVRTVMVAATGGAARTVSVRGAPGTGQVPVMVVDVTGVEETPALIRAGASDAALHSATDDEICKKVWRLVRRGR